ncbi:MAG: response regulator transcription factor [Sphingobacteriales bacterium]|nr:response regulator transcription factor [Sphingobacteriales bacterium]MBI3720315.1 response regulator transcription factor [Sphingobacteriales bacterium]
MEKINILIADDHKLIRDTWSYILNNDSRFTVTDQCASGEEAVVIAKEKRPDIVLMDINMSEMNGLDATEQIRKYAPTTKILAVSMHNQPLYVKKIMKMGARGYITKNSSVNELLTAIVEVYSGNKYICDEMKQILSDQALVENEKQGLNALSEREIEIIQLIKNGLSSKEIAAQLEISLKTVEVHRHNILKKLNLKNTAALVNFINTSGAGI